MRVWKTRNRVRPLCQTPTSLLLTTAIAPSERKTHCWPPPKIGNVFWTLHLKHRQTRLNKDNNMAIWSRQELGVRSCSVPPRTFFVLTEMNVTKVQSALHLWLLAGLQECSLFPLSLRVALGCGDVSQQTSVIESPSQCACRPGVDSIFVLVYTLS